MKFNIKIVDGKEGAAFYNTEDPEKMYIIIAIASVYYKLKCISQDTGVFYKDNLRMLKRVPYEDFVKLINDVSVTDGFGIDVCVDVHEFATLHIKK